MRAMRATNGFFGLVFLASVPVQFNDPDPVVWILAYSSAAAMCLAWDRRRLARAVPVLFALVSCVAAAVILAHLPGDVDVGAALTQWGMAASGSEELREMGGLTLVALWSGALAVYGRRRSPESTV
jgi:hypothetical protein